MSICRVVSCVVGRGCLLWPVLCLAKTLLAFGLLHSVPQGQTCLLLHISLEFLLLHSIPLWWKGDLFLVLVLECLVGPNRTIQYHGNPSLCPNQEHWRSWSWTVLWRPSRTNTPKRYPFHHRGLECKQDVRKYLAIWQRKANLSLEHRMKQGRG